MRVVIVGSGPTGLLLGCALARRGHEVTSVDRDPGPNGEEWRRRGVMQFEHAHAFRMQVHQTLERELPEALAAWRELGAQPAEVPGPDGVPMVMAMLSRRSTFERALRGTAQHQEGLTLVAGHVDGLVVVDGRVRGVRVDGVEHEADLVVDASGRAGRLGVAGPDLDGDCGLAYVDRTYRLRPGAEPGPMSNPLAFAAFFDGYQCLVFVHERRHFSVVLIRPTADPDLKDLRETAAFEAVCRAIPGVADWVDPARSEPTSGVMIGAALRNVYRRQAGLPGLVAVGDSVATTTPTRGRGIAMAYMQVAALLRLLDEGADPATVAVPFGAWCDDHIEPWVSDHIAIDGGTARRWQGEDLDLSGALTSDLIADAAEADPRIGEYAAGYFSMTALPESLRPAEPWAREVYESGWRPAYSEGPGRDDVVALIRGALADA